MREHDRCLWILLWFLVHQYGQTQAFVQPGEIAIAYTLRQVEQLASTAPDPTREKPTEKIAASAHLNDLAQALTRAAGLKVTVHAGKRKNSGRVVLHYTSLDEFEQIAKYLGAKNPTE